MMEERLGDLLHSDEQLRNTLHANDKEKLRQKLELLQREHRRTFQRLRRAEHQDSVRGHIRSKTTQHNNHDQTKADIKPCSSAAEGTKGALPGTFQKHQLSPGVATALNNNIEKKTQTIGLSLLSDTAYTPTSDSSQDSAQIPKTSSSLRLRSRRSRIRWAKRSAQSDQSSANSQDAPKETENVTEQRGNGKTLFLNDAEVSHASEELFSPSQTESPSLLLPHWKLQGQAEKEETRNQTLTLENGIDCEENPLTSASVLLDTKAVTPDTNGSTRSRCLNVCDNREDHLDDTEKGDTQQADKSETSKNATEAKMEKPEREDDSKRLLDSCTLVEGLLFPAEYYVRTTRRMAVSQSQPDMNAIILSHLTRGRPRRGRGRGRPPNRTASVDRESVLEAFKDSSANNSPGSCEISNGISCSLDSGVSSVVAPPGRGRRGRRGRGRGRGRGRTPGRTARRKEDMKENTDNALADDISLALSPSKFGLNSEEAVPEDVLTEDACGDATGVTGSEVQTLNGHSLPHAALQSNQSFKNDLQKNAEDWPSLLLPSSSQSGAPPLSPLPPIQLLKTLLGSHIQDFHLPDDQFASLKLLKLRQIAAGVEQFTPYNTPARNHSTFSPRLTPLSLSPTPDIRQTCSVSVMQNDNAKLVEKILDSNVGEFDVTVQEKQEVVCPCPEIFNEMPTQEGKNGTSEINSSGDQTESKILAQDCDKMSTPGDESTALDKEINVKTALDSMESVAQTKHKIAASIDSLPENLALKDNSVRLPNISVNWDTDGLNVEKGNCVQSESRILPKTVSVLESSSKNCSEANSENIPNMTKNYRLDCDKLYHANHPTQLLLSPSLESASCPLTLPHLGFTPQMMPMMTPVKSPRSPPALTLPPARRPTSQAGSPPALSPCPASPLRSRPPSLPLTPPSHPRQGQCEAPGEPSEREERQLGATVHGHGEEAKSYTYTLKTPAGGSLVDVCCVPSSSGSEWVAAAGTWAVCLWRSQGRSDWNLFHTWSFQEPVISVFPVPDAPDLLCVTLGQLEIRQVRVLSCCSLSQTVLCDCVVQMAMGAPNSRVVCSSHTSTTSIIRVFTLSDHASPPHCLPLVSPGGSLSSLASVDGLPDALIGTDESGSLLIWNMKTGHVLQKVTLGDGLSHSACLRGYSHSGALFALMQHHSLGSLKGPSEGPETEDRSRALFSLLAINPRNGKSVLATHFCPPDDWSGRLCEADVLGCRLAGLSQSGGVCVWDLEHPRDPPWPVGAPEGESWQLARWGGHDVLLTALHTGDVTLHCYGDTHGIPLSQRNTGDKETSL